MQDEREPYVKPAIVRLEHTADLKVSMTSGCKTGAAGIGGSNSSFCDNVINNCTIAVS